MATAMKIANRNLNRHSMLVLTNNFEMFFALNADDECETKNNEKSYDEMLCAEYERRETDKFSCGLQL